MTDLRRGDVIAYPYLWQWQHDRGERGGENTVPFARFWRSNPPTASLISRCWRFPVSRRAPIRSLSKSPRSSAGELVYPSSHRPG